MACTNREKGFTLVELLIVIAIIGVLSSVVMASLNTARAKSRESLRKEQVNQIRLAASTYASDNNGSFPSAGWQQARCLGLPDGQTCWPGYVLNAGGSGIQGSTALITAFSQTMRSIPRDPAPTRTVGDAYLYWWGTADVHCNGTDSVPNGYWIAWYPETASPNTDTACAPGNFACCSAAGCGSHYFCVLRVD